MNRLVIRGATVVDGLGEEPVRADVKARDRRIRAVGNQLVPTLRSETLGDAADPISRARPHSSVESRE